MFRFMCAVYVKFKTFYAEDMDRTDYRKLNTLLEGVWYNAEEHH